MGGDRSESVLKPVQTLFGAGALGGLPDGELLARFARDREEAAFAALVARHGPMVLGLCRRLAGAGDAEDAFQATFLVLARRAGGLRDPDLLGPWLFGVARRTAEKARRRAARRRDLERRGGMMRVTEAAAGPDEADLGERAALLHEELGRLPSAFRTALILCHLEGLTHDEAARRLRVPVGTVRSRLSRGRDRLRSRLALRGLSAPAILIAAASASAAVPPSLLDRTALAAARVAAGRSAAGAATAAAVELSREVARSLFMARIPGIASAVLAISVVGGVGGLALARYLDEPPQPGAPVRVAARKDEPRPRPAEDPASMMEVAGRVLDPDGKPVAGAKVAVLARTRAPGRGGSFEDRQVLGNGESDGAGGFRIRASRTSSSRYAEVKVLANAEGFGLGWSNLNADAESPAAEVRLRPEQVVRGRLVDAQGRPAAGVEVVVFSISVPTDLGTSADIFLPEPLAGLTPWPKPPATDAQGRFTLRGLGRGLAAGLVPRDPRFAGQHLFVTADDPGPTKEFAATLGASKLIEGRVTYADTGKPVPHAVLNVAASEREFGSMYTTKFLADAEGRFRLNPSNGNYFRVSAYAPPGEPYVVPQRAIDWPAGAATQTLDLALPRGELIVGTVTEEGTGRPVAGASVEYWPRNRPDRPGTEILSGWQAAVPTGPDGRYAIAVTPDARPDGRVSGTLLVYGPSLDYVYREIGEERLHGDRPGGRRHYAHAILPYAVEAGAGPLTLDASLKPGVTLKGTAVDPDGRPVAAAEVSTRLAIYPLVGTWSGHSTIPVRDGAFELHGLDPDQTATCVFLDAPRGLGVAEDFSGKSATAGPVTVRLQPCGSARIRLVAPDGHPIAGRELRASLGLHLVVRPGRTRNDQTPQGRDELTADEDFVANIDRLHYWNGPKSDADGRIALPFLVPGAPYRLIDNETIGVVNQGSQVWRDFTVKPGETVDLGDVVIRKPEAK